ncbi:MAG: DUF126 domain-containing protein [Gemmatimonadota bacterium]|nr:DUF126 domain-containing protein [Gemmatimonadota bacterium]
MDAVSPRSPRKDRGPLPEGSAAEGRLLWTEEPLSFWGGYDPGTGEIIDRRHPLAGRIAAGRVLALPSTRGSSTTTAVLLESIRQGTSPAAILTRGTDTFLTLAAIVAEELYGRTLPVVPLEPDAWTGLAGAERVAVSADGLVTTA